MNTKLTLTIEEEVIKKAKEYAGKKNRSLSSIIENYLKTLTKDENPGAKQQASPVIKSLRGSFKMPDSADYKKDLQDTLAKKYL